MKIADMLLILSPGGERDRVRGHHKAIFVLKIFEIF
jgi:hypothetical protein